MGYRVEVDKRSCQSSGNCVHAAPDAFRLDEDGLAEVLPGAADAPREQLLAVARGCPALAIAVFGAHGEELDPGR